MDWLTVACKSVIALVLIVAGGAKLADPASFAAAIRTFTSQRPAYPVVKALAMTIASTELSLGVVSLSLPSVWVLNVCVFAMACGFLLVSLIGYVFHRGRPCRCFGALSRRKFDASSVLRGLGLVLLSAVATLHVQQAAIGVSVQDNFLLAVVASLVACAAFAAARALALNRGLEVEI